MSQIEWEEERLIWLIHFSQSTTTMRAPPLSAAYEPSIIIFTLLLPSIPIASFHSVYSHLKSRGGKIKTLSVFFHFLNKSCCFWWWKKNLCPPTAVAVVLGDAVTDYGVIQSINPTRTVPTGRAGDFFSLNLSQFSSSLPIIKGKRQSCVCTFRITSFQTQNWPSKEWNTISDANSWPWQYRQRRI